MDVPKVRAEPIQEMTSDSDPADLGGKMSLSRRLGVQTVIGSSLWRKRHGGVGNGGIGEENEPLKKFRRVARKSRRKGDIGPGFHRRF